jgi:peptidoglycan hydrolase CwlO-like protein
MKGKSALITLGVVSVVLLVALIVRHANAVSQKKKDDATIAAQSNQVVQLTVELTENKQVITNLESDLTARRADILALSNNLVDVTTNLTYTQAALKVSQEEMAKRDAKIAELEAQNQSLEKQAVDLTNTLAALNVAIEDTKGKLAAAEGDKAALQKELKRLMGEKAELERKFNDLDVLRAQVKKIKQEVVVARRLSWFHMGVTSTEKKGAEKIIQLTPPPASTPAAAPAAQKRYDLNVEVNSDGSVKVIEPLTNSAAH